MGEAWTQQVREALVWLKLGITTWETLSLSLAPELLGIKWLPRFHSIWTGCPVTRGQSSLITQVALTGEPRGTTELGVWTVAHGWVSSSKQWGHRSSHRYVECNKSHQMSKRYIKVKYLVTLNTYRFFLRWPQLLSAWQSLTSIWISWRQNLLGSENEMHYCFIFTPMKSIISVAMPTELYAALREGETPAISKYIIRVVMKGCASCKDALTAVYKMQGCVLKYADTWHKREQSTVVTAVVHICLMDVTFNPPSLVENGA